MFEEILNTQSPYSQDLTMHQEILISAKSWEVDEVALAPDNYGELFTQPVEELGYTLPEGMFNVFMFNSLIKVRKELTEGVLNDETAPKAILEVIFNEKNYG